MSAKRDGIEILARQVVETYAAKGMKLATVESCTGGMVAAAITDIAGSSAVLDRGFVTYSNDAKTDLVGVEAQTLEANGAVSEAVACEMAEGGVRRSRGLVAIAITGVAGPGGGSESKPVGLVHFACASPDGTTHREERFGDIGRAEIRIRSVEMALRMLLVAIEHS
ncbi:hypothetical protein FP2506_06451 [Fulvimarina pelagi HTCC2506]|uniref:CinA C-terminal domain-containing protein n=1 Tax=Fulvimarina pelagi HTCC2506 TaxID=314231 RepID=Q0G7A6_9HYPH|nr:CinA family protein [Fulvimarina pelagi]EAU42458.1 hypothetical protein FP2506_06451 [Fulvimarina pelagi HTCC2506]